MKIGISNQKFVNFNVEHNLNVICNTLHKNSDCDFILFGEAFLHGFDGLKWSLEDDLKIALKQDSMYIHQLQKTCLKSKTALGFGYFEQYLGNIYCSYMIVNKHGEIIYNYRRQSVGWKIPNMPAQYKEGTDLGSFKLEGVTFDILLCGDGYTDYVINKHHHKNHILLWPLYVNMNIYEHIAEYVEIASERFNTALIINSLSDEPKAIGGSFVVSNNEVLCQTVEDNESVLKVVIE